ncbi:hypothetical protein BG011_003152 [Mortierella polycephala]|uniref:UBC core domain-containing protein n=1 Tax=Mortierella polycephala TaxID=41804 RepID=A0A9P6Q557_9FUNG|nr:hypothetical protein BG011_003152 [Mortierella polycephala]
MAKALITAKVFLEDAVYLKDKPERLGLVVKTWHDFDSGESDSEDEDSSGPLDLQQVVVHWVDGSAPQTLHEDDLVIADRSFSHGDVVKRSPNDIISGSVIDVKVELDLEKICPPMNRLYGIDAMHVDFCQEFVVNNHVIYDGWLGVIEEVQDEVTVLLNDSSVCVVKNSDDLDLRDQIHDQSCFFPDSLAPGHAVFGPSRVFKNADYLTGSYPSQKQGYVLRTEVTSITVNWLSFNPLALDQTPGVAPPPRVLDDFENISVYKSVEQHCTFELMDRVRIADKETLQALRLKEHCPYLKSKSTRLQCPDKTHNHATKFTTEEMKVIGTKTRVTVQWQDLSISSDVDSTTLVPYLNMDDQDVWPADYVLLKPGEVLKDEPGGVNFDRKKSDMLGIVQSVNAKERTTLVKWFSEERDQGLEQVAEELSLYEIMSHPDLKFRMGDKVVVSREREQNPSSDIAPRAPSVDDILSLVSRGNEIFNELMREKQASRRKSVESISPRSIERRGTVLLERYGVEGVEALDRYISETNKMASETVYWLVNRGDPLKPTVPEDVLANLSQHEKDVETIRTRLNWVGQIWKVYQDRSSALIRFMDGTMEEIPVGRIMVVEDDDDEDDEDEEDGEEDGEFEEYDFDRDEPEEISTDDSWETDSAADDDSMSDIEEHIPAVKQDESDPEHVVEIGVSGDGATPSPGDQPTETAEITEAAETTETTEAKETTETTTNSVQELETFDPLPEPENMTVDGQYTSDHRRHSAVEQENWESFLLLDETPTDHHFFQSASDSMQSDKAWVKRIVKEHAILASSLPDGIRVRTFEDRMDLLRVLIQGPDHTPYRNALFLFDFKLPALFPSQPPIAFFHSWTGGIGRINPNLYEDGNVCLSLLNTWHGKDQTETWTPSSSILQLLISLQGLVLVPEPYYNEAGFEKFVGTKEAARNSELYNEKVYLLSLKTIQTILNNPPTPFQKEVRHFYFERKKLEQTVIEGFELIAASEATINTDMEETGGQEDADAADAAHGSPAGMAPRPVITRISKGALMMLKKHIDTLSLSLEE